MEDKRSVRAFLVENFQKQMEGKMTLSQELDSEFPGIGGGKELKPKSSLKLNPEYNEASLEVERILLEDFVKPLLLLGKYFLPFPNVLKYDPIGKRVVCGNRGSWTRKLFCVLWELIILYRLVIKVVSSWSSISHNTNSDSIISFGAYSTFILFNLASFHYCWMGGETCCKIFNRTLELAKVLYLKERCPSRIRCIKYGVHASWIVSTFYVMLTVALYMIQMFSHTRMPGRGRSSSFRNSSRSILKQNFDVTEIHSGTADYNMFLKVMSTLGSFFSIHSWMMSYLQIAIWALYFRQVIVLFYWRIEMKRELGLAIKFPTEIRTFNKIVSVMDQYNKISGFVNLLGVVVVVTYISTSVRHAFSDLLNVFQMGAGLHLLLSYVPLVGAAVLAAEVQRVAALFAGILKDEYERFTKDCGDPAESLCGIAMVHYDLSTSSIGLKGLGFYTVSYQFITTIVSVIITYSILVLQLFPHESSVEPP